MLFAVTPSERRWWIKPPGDRGDREKQMDDGIFCKLYWQDLVKNVETRKREERIMILSCLS